MPDAKNNGDVFVLIPGIMGSVLEKDGKDVWALSLSGIFRAITSAGGSLEQMALWGDDPNAPDLGDGFRATRLMPDVTLIPGLIKVDGYSRVASELMRRFRLEQGKSYFPFPYDWRRDLRSAARRLQSGSEAWLRERRKEFPGAKLVLVCHSMGGLLARYFLEVLDGWQDTRALLTIATPHQGSVNALDYLANGFRKKVGPITLLDLTEALRSFTAVYQLLPTYPCVEVAGGRLVRVADLSGLPNLDRQRAVAAAAFHQEILAGTQRRAPDRAYDIYPIVGTYQPTLQGARLEAGKLEAFEQLAGHDFDGDGTVPRVSATPPELAAQHRERYWAGVHGSLQNTDSVLEQIDGVCVRYLIEDLVERDQAERGAMRRIRGAPVDIALSLDDAFDAEEPVLVRARPSREPVTLIATVVNASSGAKLAQVRMSAAGDGWQQAEFGELPAGLYRAFVDPLQPGSANSVHSVFGVFGRAPRRAAALQRSVPTSTYGLKPAPLVWDANLVVAPVGSRIAEVAIDPTGPAWVVLRQEHPRLGVLFYALRPKELESLRGTDLHEKDCSSLEKSATLVTTRDLPLSSHPAAARKVAVDAAGTPIAVGVPVGLPEVTGVFVQEVLGPDPLETTDEAFPVAPPEGFESRLNEPDVEAERPAPGSAPSRATRSGGNESVTLPPGGKPPGGSSPSGARPPGSSSPTGGKSHGGPVPATENWRRYPDVFAPPASIGALVPIRITLALEPTSAPLAVAFRGVPAGAQSIEVLVQVASPWLEVEKGGWQALAVPRGAAAECVVNAKLLETARGLPAADVFVSFIYAGRHCGLVRASLPIRPEVQAGAIAASILSAVSPLDLQKSPAPRVTLGIHRIDAAPPALFWTLTSADLSVDVRAQKALREPGGAWVRSLFAACGTLDPAVSSHLPLMEGIGDQLWDEIPVAIQDAYRRLRQEAGDFSIQIITDEPYIPWELARPQVDGRAIGTLSFLHPIARWITNSREARPVRLPRGDIAALAPDYSLRGRTLKPLPAAADEAEMLVRDFQALRISGSKREVLRILQDVPRHAFSVLHFAGHGSFSPDNASLSVLHLEDADLLSLEIRRAETLVGDVRHPLVFLNACEGGATGAVLSSVGGWAEAFLCRHFGGVIAPLWSVYDEDAREVSRGFYELVLDGEVAISEALQRIRKRYGNLSPTFYSYLFYGDVMARFESP